MFTQKHILLLRKCEFCKHSKILRILIKTDTVTGMTRMSSTEDAKQKPFMSFGFSAEAGATKPPTVAGGAGDPSRRESTHVPSVNVAPTPAVHDMTSDTPEIRKYKKRFNSEILCAALWGVNLLIGMSFEMLKP